MTIYDYHMTMKRVRIADLKANLSRHLHYVRRGHVLTVLDRETAVAQLVPLPAGRVPPRAPTGGPLPGTAPGPVAATAPSGPGCARAAAPGAPAGAVIAYLDASVLLRVILGQPDRLAEWESIETGVASALVEVECLRTLDRLRLRSAVSDADLVARREAVYRLTEELEIVEPTVPVLRRAAQPLPTPLGTLDAIHLATALMWREARDQNLVVATHDQALALAARGSGFRVVGV